MKIKNPLELAGRMARKAAEIFRRERHPGWAYWGDIAADACAEARAGAAEAEKADRAAVELLDAVLADGVVTQAEIKALREARRMVAESAAIDGELAGGLSA